MTREEWLITMTDALRPKFAVLGHPLPSTIRVTCGWPSSRATAHSNRRIGECYSPECSSDRATEICISPSVADSLTVAGTLVHELVHAALGAKFGHRRPFAQLAGAIGLTPPWTSTGVSAALQTELTRLFPGPYPHERLTVSRGFHPGSRLIKVACSECGYICRVTRRWLDGGAPICPCNGNAMKEA